MYDYLFKQTFGRRYITIARQINDVLSSQPSMSQHFLIASYIAYSEDHPYCQTISLHWENVVVWFAQSSSLSIWHGSVLYHILYIVLSLIVIVDSPWHIIPYITVGISVE